MRQLSKRTKIRLGLGVLAVVLVVGGTFVLNRPVADKHVFSQKSDAGSSDDQTVYKPLATPEAMDPDDPGPQPRQSNDDNSGYVAGAATAPTPEPVQATPAPSPTPRATATPLPTYTPKPTHTPTPTPCGGCGYQQNAPGQACTLACKEQQ